MDFANASAKPADVHYQAVVDQFSIPVPLDPLMGMFFVTIFALAVLATARQASWGLGILVFVSPFALYRDVLGTTVTLPKIALLGVIVGLATYPEALTIVRERRYLPIVLALAAVAGATLLSIVNATHHAPVLREFLKSLEHIALVATAYVAYRLDRNDGLLVRALTVSVLIVAASALVQELTGAPSGLRIGSVVVPRIAGLLEGPNQLAGYLELGIAMLGAWAMTRPGRLLGTTLALAGVSSMLTLSRGGALGIAIVLIVFAMVARKRWKGAGVPVLLGSALGIAFAFMWTGISHVMGFARLDFDNDYSGGVGNRGELWRAAWIFWRSHPWLGIGAGNYELELSRVGLVGVRTHANSWYLQSLAEGGVVLFAATVAFVVATLNVLRQKLREATPWTLGAFAATIALSLHQIFDYLIFYQKIGTPWMLAIGIGAAATASAAIERSPTCE